MAARRRVAAAVRPIDRSATALQVFANCAPKFQHLLARELQALGVRRVQQQMVKRPISAADRQRQRQPQRDDGEPGDGAARTTDDGEQSSGPAGDDGGEFAAGSGGEEGDAYGGAANGGARQRPAREAVPTEWVPAGGVEFRVSQRDLWRLANQCRLAEGFRVRVGERRVHNWADLRAAVTRVPWHVYFPRAGACPRVAASSYRSTLYHTVGIQQRIADTLTKHMHLKPAEDNASFGRAAGAESGGEFDAAPRAAQARGAEDGDAGAAAAPTHPQVHTRIEHNLATFSVNATGEALHKRGYKQRIAVTPLRETLAAALVHTAMNDVFGAHRVTPNASALAADAKQRAAAPPTDSDAYPSTTGAATAAATGAAAGAGGAYTPYVAAAPSLVRSLWDPFCGSGTFVLEALDANYRLLRTLPRAFDFEHWPSHDALRYKQLLRALLAHDVHVPDDVRFLGTDVSHRAIAIAQANAAAAGCGADSPFARALTFAQSDFAKAEARVPEGAFVVTNVPYATRPGSATGAEPIDSVYHRFGRVLERRSDLEHVYVLSAIGSPFRPATGLRWQRMVAFEHGGLPVEFLRLARRHAHGRGDGADADGDADAPVDGPFARRAAESIFVTRHEGTNQQSAFRKKLKAAAPKDL